MKKISLILVIILMVTFGVYADDPPALGDTASLHLSTIVEGFADVLVGDYTETLPESLSDFRSLSAVGTATDPLVFSTGSGGNMEQHFAIYVAANEPGDYEVKTTAKPLKNSGGYIMPYTVQVGTGNKLAVNSENGTELTLINEFTVSGLTLKRSLDVNLEILSSVFDSAEAGAYSSVWTIELIKN